MKLTGKSVGSIFQTDTAVGDNSTVAFSTSVAISQCGFLLVFVDGVLRDLTTDFTVNYSTHTVTFGTAPKTGQTITVIYIKNI